MCLSQRARTLRDLFVSCMARAQRAFTNVYGLTEKDHSVSQDRTEI